MARFGGGTPLAVRHHLEPAPISGGEGGIRTLEGPYEPLLP